jgi:hypothetical protein
MRILIAMSNGAIVLVSTIIMPSTVEHLRKNAVAMAQPTPAGTLMVSSWQRKPCPWCISMLSVIFQYQLIRKPIPIRQWSAVCNSI